MQIGWPPWNFKMEHVSVPFDPTCIVLFNIRRRTITREIKKLIQEKLFLHKLQTYTCTRLCWTKLTFESVDWDTMYSQVYSHYPQSRKFFYQFGWKNLPTGRRLHCRKPRFNDRCPSCGCDNEWMITYSGVPMRTGSHGVEIY